MSDYFKPMLFVVSHGASMQHPVLLTEEQVKNAGLVEAGVIVLTAEEYKKKLEEDN
jgi:hypothetical protein